ncbi:MAG: protein-disulfide reductase DsbD family protein [Sediminimonas sp.]|uniref:protein-disulfide reductase DsbD domain-containing protein n=1 Tax=Sediminimonas sp. TaxID=2823379 RepID=UPI00287059AE|nr:protein-disulfide reductase DsbD domain-containing protein [Sediminimonas sp.]MDR9484530.1 protein-disulfide reductase DsbD family protein [Sediminimonas sp.]
MTCSAPRALCRLLILFCALFILPVPSTAQEGMARLTVLPGWRSDEGVHIAALHVTLAPGWKTYWRAPGDAGIPPEIDLRGAQNLAGVAPVWPTPVVFWQNGMRSIGYKNDLVLPLRVAAQSPGQDITLAGRVTMGVCEDICIPFTVSFDTTLPAGQSRPDPRIIEALKNRPLSAEKAGVRDVRCTITPTADGIEIAAAITMPAAGGTETVVLETDDPQIWVAEADSVRKGGVLHAKTELAHVYGDAFAVNRAGLRLTVLGKDRAVDIKGCPAR